MAAPYPDPLTAAREIVEAGRRMYQHRLIVARQGNLSARIAPDRVLTTPAGLCKGDLTEAQLVVVDLGGVPVSGGRASTELAMHMAVYRTREDLHAVVHGHPMFATALAAAGRALDACLLPEAVVELGAVPLSDYATPSTDAVAATTAEMVREHDAFLLRNHGAVAAASSVMDAFFKLETVEHLAATAVLAQVAGGATALNREQVDALHAVRSVYGLGGDSPPDCLTAEDLGSPQRSTPHRSGASSGANRSTDGEQRRLARVVAEEIARAFGERQG